MAKVRFPTPVSCGKTPLTAKALSKSYGSLEIFCDVDVAVDRGSRVAILGLNGAGKTTLLRMLAGLLPPDTGSVDPGHGLRLGYYAQEHETLDVERTILEHMRAAAPEQTDTDLRKILGAFLFTGDDVDKPAGVLSGGEKTRLALATLVCSGANVLLLDEPTNNLDPVSREQVLDAIARYPGAIVLVTHDPGAVLALKPDRAILLPGRRRGRLERRPAGARRTRLGHHRIAVIMVGRHPIGLTMMRVSWRSVGAMVARVLADLDAAAGDRWDGIRRIGIDEISYKRGHKFLTVVVDHDSGRLLWMTPGRTKRALGLFFERLGPDRCAQLELVSADGADWIAEVVALNAPQAKRCMDPFHVVKWGMEAMDTTRRQVAAQARHDGDADLAKALGAGCRFALWKNPDHLTVNQQATLADIERINEPVFRAYILKEQLRAVFSHHDQNGPERLDAWIDAAAHSGLPAFVRLAERIEDYSPTIKNALEHKLSNARVESINTKIRLITRVAFGFRSAEALIAWPCSTSAARPPPTRPNPRLTTHKISRRAPAGHDRRGNAITTVWRGRPRRRSRWRRRRRLAAGAWGPARRPAPAGPPRPRSATGRTAARPPRPRRGPGRRPRRTPPRRQRRRGTASPACCGSGARCAPAAARRRAAAPRR